MARRTSSAWHRTTSIIRWFRLRKWSVGVHFIVGGAPRLWHWFEETWHLGHVPFDDGTQNRSHHTFQQFVVSGHRLDYWQSFGRIVTVAPGDSGPQFLQMPLLRAAMLCIRIRWTEISTTKYPNQPIHGFLELRTAHQWWVRLSYANRSIENTKHETYLCHRGSTKLRLHRIRQPNYPNSKIHRCREQHKVIEWEVECWFSAKVQRWEGPKLYANR